MRHHICLVVPYVLNIWIREPYQGTLASGRWPFLHMLNSEGLRVIIKGVLHIGYDLGAIIYRRLICMANRYW
jgi:hypothetical protein